METQSKVQQHQKIKQECNNDKCTQRPFVASPLYFLPLLHSVPKNKINNNFYKRNFVRGDLHIYLLIFYNEPSSSKAQLFPLQFYNRVNNMYKIVLTSRSQKIHTKTIRIDNKHINLYLYPSSQSFTLYQLIQQTPTSD